ncbi:hypothetical protein HZS_3244 [Henneguya salminicola]|nr:hypothetical protein HZS_3244 [Henneguya salminicola]
MFSVKLKLPVKKTETVDLERFLINFIRHEYGDEKLDEQKNSIKALNNLRNSALCRSTEKGAHDYKLVAEYYFCLKILEPLLSSKEGQEFVGTTWYECYPKSFFSSNKKFDNRLSFEIANVLHLLGILLFKQIECLPTETEDDLKIYIKMCNISAGIFTELKKYSEISSLAAIMDELSPDSCQVLTETCLCNSQLAFGTKFSSSAQNLKPYIRITVQAQSRISQALEIISRNEKSQFLNSVKSALTPFNLYLLCLLHKSQSCVDEQEAKYGEKLANLRKALEIFNEYEKNNTDAQIKKMGQDLRKLVSTAEQENDLIYHAAVPKAVSLCFLKPLKIAEIVPPTLENLLNKQGCSIAESFKSLIPTAVRNAKKLYFTKLSEIQSRLTAHVQQSNSIFYSFHILFNCSLFAEMNIPACFEKGDLKSLPPSVVEKVQELAASGGVPAVESNFKLLNKLTNNCRLDLDRAWESLKQEENEDTQYRRNYSSLWTRPSSAEASKSWRQSLQQYADHLKNAENADNSLSQKLNEIKPSLALLSRGGQNLADLNNQKNLAISHLGDSFLNEIKKIYYAYKKIEKDRIDWLNKLKPDDKSVETFFIDHLNSDGTLNIEQDCQTLINTLNPIVRQIEHSINEEQTPIVHSLICANDRIKALGQPTNTLDQALKDYNTYILIRNGINEGFEFYNKCASNITSQLSKINDFCYARQIEAQDIIDQIKKSQTPCATSHYYSSNQATYTQPQLPYYYNQYASASPQPSNYYPAAPNTLPQFSSHSLHRGQR